MIKKIIVNTILITITLVLSLFIFQPTGKVTSNENSINIYVSPSGNNANSGTIENPFLTLEKARDYVREIKTTSTKPINIYLRQGAYYLNDTILFDTRDSGSTNIPITYQSYPGEEAIIIGGKKLNLNWQRYNTNIYYTTTDESFNSLFVNDERAIRARDPNNGNYQSQGGSNSRVSFVVASGTVNANWRNFGEIEIITDNKWEQSRFKLNSINGNTLTVQGGLNQYTNFTDSYTGGKMKYYIENIFEKLDNPGEWYLDKTEKKLYYYPKQGENINSSYFIIPKVKTILSVTGSPNNFVQNINFVNLTFAYTDFGIDSAGYQGSQAGVYIIDPATIKFTNTTNVNFKENIITHTGAYALDAYSVQSVISGNKMYDLGAGGIRIGKEGFVQNTDRTRTEIRDNSGTAKNNIISDNEIYDIGKNYAEGVGIWIGVSENNIVEYNILHDGKYSGISVGWRWSKSETACKNNTIQKNTIYNFVKELNDGAGIYTLGRQDGTLIKYNYIYNIVPTSMHITNQWIQGIHLDEGSSKITVQYNLINNIQNGIILNMGNENVIERNVFSNAKNKFVIYNINGTRDPKNTFRYNVLYCTQPMSALYWLIQPNTTFQEHANNFYYKTSSCSGDWTKPSIDSNQKNENPLFINPENGNFQVQAGSPILTVIDNSRLDFSKAKPRFGQFQKNINLLEIISTPISQIQQNPQTDTTQTCTSFEYSDWSSCSENGIKTRTIKNYYPSGCSGGNPALSESCSYENSSTTNLDKCTEQDWNYSQTSCDSQNTFSRSWYKINDCDETNGINKPLYEQISCNTQTNQSTCTSFTYTEWTSCNQNNLQTRQVTNSYPINCTGGNPVITQSCIQNSNQQINPQTNQKNNTPVFTLPETSSPNLFKKIKCKFRHLFDSEGYTFCISI